MITNEILTSLLVIPVMVICLCIGWAYKHLTSADNKYIPVVVMVLGGILSCIFFHRIDIEIIGAGFITGLASCGCHGLVDNLINGASNGMREAIEMTDTEALEFMEEHPELFEDFELDEE